ncbi:MAG: 50S ribosomal protein L11 methyltransferase [Clostridiales bacterium]|nr:50S ribosomal protein L11 methyltransferase [Clostridiales bacterium]
MRWVEISITTTEDASDAICEMLAQIGADGIAVKDPYEIARIIEDPESLAYADEGYIDSLGTDVSIKAYFAEFDDGVRLGPKSEEYVDPNGVGMIYGNLADKTMSVEDAVALVKEKLDDIAQFLPMGKGFEGYQFVSDKDWENEWKKDYKSFRISDRVIICPSWEEVQAGQDDIVVKLDPGSAFGTGTHETTSMCAGLIDETIRPDDKVLDLGTGSGILAIIADKLGAAKIEAVDIDRLAVDVAVDNCNNNGCGDIDCYTGELSTVKSNDYSLIIANIIADIIAAIAPDVPSHLAPGGRFICSGIINTKKDKVEKALDDAGFKVIKHLEKNDWQAYLCEMK